MVLIYNVKISNEIQENLMKQNAICIPSVLLDALPESILSHPDIQFHYADENTGICAPECYDYYRKLFPESIELIAGKKHVSGTYPMDAAYNAAVVGEYLFCNTRTVDETILEYHQRKKRTIVHVNQGYTKCNICLIGEKTLLTEDAGIHNTIIDNHLPISSHLLPPGEVSLDGFPYGFIGGSCGLCKKTLFWYGSIERCSYGEEIKRIMREEEVKSVFLSMEKVIDFGGIICFP